MNITLQQLRNLAGEIGCELIYLMKVPKGEMEKVSHANFSPRKKMGLSKNGTIYLTPINIDSLHEKLLRAVNRQKKGGLVK